MFSKVELIAGAVSVLCMALAIFMLQARSNLGQMQISQPAQLAKAGIVVVESENGFSGEVIDKSNNPESMKIDDVKIGIGDAVEKGDKVAVHYSGTLQDGGTEFDNSRKRGDMLEFKVGSGMVIQGWDEGIVGMKVGGQRVLVIPPEKAYGTAGAAGVIPPNATLVFTIELVEIK